MHPDVVAIWAKTKGLGHLCTLDTYLGYWYFFFFLEIEHIKPYFQEKNIIDLLSGSVANS